MERVFSTLLVALVLSLTLSSCLGQANDTAKNETFVLYDVKDTKKVCLRMTASIVVNITYLVNGTSKNESVVFPLTNDAEVDSDNSTCDMGAARALLYVRPTPLPDDYAPSPYYIIFNFTGSNEKGDQHWGWGNIGFGVEAEILEDYDGAGLLKFTTDAALHGDPNSKIEFERSYTCNSSQRVSFPKENDISAFIYVTQLQVQAFHFRNETSGEFDNARTCLLDSSGKANKIVPIAVGAALAGLVVVVLIAYLIGRLRSRRQSSYEALS